MSDIHQVPLGQLHEQGFFVLQTTDKNYFSAVDFQKIRHDHRESWTRPLMRYLEFYQNELLRVMKEAMSSKEVSSMMKTAHSMLERSVYVFCTSLHPFHPEAEFLGGSGHVRSENRHDLLPSEMAGVEMPRSQNQRALEIVRLSASSKLHMHTRAHIIREVLQVHTPIFTNDIRDGSVCMRTSKKHIRYYSRLFGNFFSQIHYPNDRDAVIQLNAQKLLQNKIKNFDLGHFQFPGQALKTEAI